MKKEIHYLNAQEHNQALLNYISSYRPNRIPSGKILLLTNTVETREGGEVLVTVEIEDAPNDKKPVR